MLERAEGHDDRARTRGRLRARSAPRDPRSPARRPAPGAVERVAVGRQQEQVGVLLRAEPHDILGRRGRGERGHADRRAPLCQVASCRLERSPSPRTAPRPGRSSRARARGVSGRARAPRRAGAAGRGPARSRGRRRSSEAAPRRAGVPASAGSWRRIARSSSRSSGPGSRPSSSSSSRLPSRYTSSASDWRPARYSARMRSTRGRSCNGRAPTSACSSATSSGPPPRSSSASMPTLDGVLTELAEARRLRLDERLVLEVGERRASPERERVAQRRGTRPRIFVPRAREQPLELVQVELTRCDSEQVAGAACLQHVAGAAQCLPERRDVDLDRLHRGWRDLAGPERLRETIGRDDLVRVQQQEREQRPLPRERPDRAGARRRAPRAAPGP